MASLSKRVRRTEEAIDWISALHDDLLVRILLLVSTKEAVTTTVLSKRWRFVWTMVPKLDFEDSNTSPRSLCSLLDKARELHKVPLETLRIHLKRKCPVDVDFRKIIANEVDRAVDRSVRVLELRLLESTNLSFIDLPKSLYTCKTLVELTLSHKIRVDVPSSACLPSLKKLSLVFVAYKDDDSLVRLLSSCPVRAQSSISLYISDNSRDALPTEKTVSCIRILCLPDEKFRRSLSLVTSLTIRLDEFSPTGKLRDITFSQLQRFKIYTTHSNWSRLLLLILNNSPRLRSLQIVSRRDYLPGYIPSWNQQSFIPSCLSFTLEVFEWKKYRGRSNDRQLMRYILANSECLKKAKVTLGSFKDKVVAKLKSMSRVSTKSQLLISRK